MEKSKGKFPKIAAIIFLVLFVATNIISIQYTKKSMSDMGLPGIESFSKIQNIMTPILGIIFIVLTYFLYRLAFRKININNNQDQFNKYYIYNMIVRYIIGILGTIYAFYEDIGIVVDAKIIIFKFFIKVMMFLGINLILNSETEENSFANIALFMTFVLIS